MPRAIQSLCINNIFEQQIIENSIKWRRKKNCRAVLYYLQRIFAQLTHLFSYFLLCINSKQIVWQKYGECMFLDCRWISNGMKLTGGNVFVNCVVCTKQRDPTETNSLNFNHIRDNYTRRVGIEITWNTMAEREKRNVKLKRTDI